MGKQEKNRGLNKKFLKIVLKENYL